MRRFRWVRLARAYSPWKLLADALPEIIQRVHAQFLRQLVVDGNLVRRLDRLHLHVELGVLAGEIGGSILGREFHLDDTFIARLGAGQLIFEARNERAAAERQIEAFGLAALERFAADLAVEIDGDRVALLGGRALALVAIGLLGIGKPLQRLLHRLVGHVGDQPLRLQLAQIGEREVGHQIHLHGEFEVRLARDHIVERVDEIHPRRGRRLDLLVLEKLLAGFVDRLVDDLAHQRFAVGLLQERDRRLARPEALEMNLRLHLGDLAGELGIQIGGPDQDGEFAVQRLGDGFGNLHL